MHRRIPHDEQGIPLAPPDAAPAYPRHRAQRRDILHHLPRDQAADGRALRQLKHARNTRYRGRRSAARETRHRARPRASAGDELGETRPRLPARARECAATDVLSVCTGIFLCGAAGLLEDRTACGPRGLQGQIRKQHPTAKLVGEKYRWIQDGNFWSSGEHFLPSSPVETRYMETKATDGVLGGITNGNDLVAAYARAGKHFPSAIVELACKMADVGDRSQVYSESPAVFTLGVVWLFVKGLFARRR
ncbi:hypothetical protein EKO27_g1291 [Xylaria grammica]|uniref:DJ-1/PfpI domain-containing protein n=1 Tax=Xylaria grammica TaxID=363999 RepID=A0A439DHC1_9PEZI|nr:hypothetical protein EKO27_g1291 [Xylaria grammica]